MQKTQRKFSSFYEMPFRSKIQKILITLKRVWWSFRR